MNINIEKKLDEVALKIPNIYLPNNNYSYEKYSCIATDQFSNDKNYWDEVEKEVFNYKSTYNMIIPEAYIKYLSEKELNEKVFKANETMKDYMKNVLSNIGENFIYVKRETTSGIRKGLIVLIDLEKYDYEKNDKILIRSTEKTVKERLPVRIKLRENAILDLPHTMVLINDKANKLFNEIENYNIKKKNENLIYDFELMKNGGNIKGYKLNLDYDSDLIEKIADILLALKKQSMDNMLYAVGDGNHSLSSAKYIYKRKGIGRYALVELVNLYDEGLSFYPIHRLLMNVDKDKFLKEFDLSSNEMKDLQTCQKILDEYMKVNKDVCLEYIHDKEECIKCGQEKNNIAIIFNSFDRDKLFTDIIKNGTLCRKSFSMGKSIDKRYYLESVKIL